MKQFNGFPKRMRYTAVPNVFFSTLLPEINDISELKVTLHLLATLLRQRGYPRLVTRSELVADAGLKQCLNGQSEPVEQLLSRVLEMAAARGSIIHLVPEQDGVTDDIYLLNTESDRKAAERIRNGELPLPQMSQEETVHQPDTAPEASTETTDIFSLYEENIGMLTPLIADELKEAEKLYPLSWIRDAVKEAASLNKRSWRYIARILERWAAEGKSDGTYQRYPAPTRDPNKYIRGKYGHMVRR
jgi:DnaD/phage-associated family protein